MRRGSENYAVDGAESDKSEWVWIISKSHGKTIEHAKHRVIWSYL